MKTRPFLVGSVSILLDLGVTFYFSRGTTGFPRPAPFVQAKAKPARAFRPLRMRRKLCARIRSSRACRGRSRSGTGRTPVFQNIGCKSGHFSRPFTGPLNDPSPSRHAFRLASRQGRYLQCAPQLVILGSGQKEFAGEEALRGESSFQRVGRAVTRVVWTVGNQPIGNQLDSRPFYGAIARFRLHRNHQR